MMWHEARKQERKIRGMLVDYKKRAERRKDYYEKIKADPTQFLQLHGRPCKIHLDPAIAIAGDSPVNMMPWQGNQDVLIDRFDVRAHLDFIPEVKQTDDIQEVLNVEERHINYERYRILVQNDFLGVGEEKFLRQLHLEEQFGPILRPTDIPDAKPKKASNAGAAIGYNYDEGPTSSITDAPPLANAIDASHLPSTIISPDAAGDDGNVNPNEEDGDDDEDEDDDDSDIDFDLCVDVSKVDTKQAHEMNTCAHMYGMQSNDFFSFLTRDVEEAENLRIAREQEEEKAMYSGRKARRERRAYRDKKLMGRKFSPPSYASRKSPTYFAYRESKSKSLSKSRSRSQSPANAGQVTYITSFGGDEPAASEIPKNSGNSVAGHSRTSVRYRSRTQKSSETRAHSRGSGRSPVFRRSKSRSRIPHGRRRSRSWSRTRRRSRTRMEDGHGVSVMRGVFRRRSRSASRGRRRSGSRNRRSLSRGRSRSHSPRRGRSTERNYNWRGGYNRNSIRRPSYPPRRYNRDSRSLSRSPSVSNRRKLNYGRGGSQSPGRKKPMNPTENKSPSPVMMRSVEIPAPPVITRYYGRNQPQQSSSELSYSSEDESMSVASSNTMNNLTTSSQQFNKALPDKNVRTGFGNSGGRNKPTSSTSSTQSVMRLTPQERLKRKMQAQLNRQFKADKRAERVRQEKVEQERIDRAEEMREISIKLRRRERQKRHQYYADETGADDRYSSVSSRSFSSSSSPEHSHSSTSRRRRRSSHRRSRSRSRGRSKSSRSRGSKSTSESPETVNRRNRPLVDY